MSFEIFPVISPGHTGNQSVITSIDPVDSFRLQKLAKEEKLTWNSFKEGEFNYVMLEHLANGWIKFKEEGNKLEDHRLILRDKKNIVFGHCFTTDPQCIINEHLDCIKELNSYKKIIVPMRDPLLTLISSSIRWYNKIEGKGKIPIETQGGPLAPMCVWLRKQEGNFERRMKRRDFTFTKEPNFSKAVPPLPDKGTQSIGNGSKKKPKKPSTQHVTGGPLAVLHPPADPEESKDFTIFEFLDEAGRSGNKPHMIGSEHILANHSEMRGFLYMWEIWARYLHELDPSYVFMDLSNTNLQGIGIANLGKVNVSKTRPLKDAYINNDVFSIAKELRSNLKALIDMEDILRPPLEELGYKDLMWWDFYENNSN